MKSKIALLLVVCIMIVSFSGCVGNTLELGKKPSIVCTVFPVYDWICEILGEQIKDFDVQMLGKNGIDLHSYQPSAQDIVLISSSDLFVYVGGSSDAWAQDVLKNSNNPNMRIVKLFDILGDDIEQPIAHEHDHEEVHGSEYDEHVWLSLRFAAEVTEALSKEIADNLDNKNASMYKNNADVYIDKLYNLDAEYKAAVDASKDKTIIVADRFPFLYLAEDYGIDYFAAFPGCSADTDVSFETVVSLAEEADRLSKNTILVTENSRESIAETVISGMKNKNVEVAVLNSCQSIAADSGTGYLDIMRDNLVSFKAALE